MSTAATDTPAPNYALTIYSSAQGAMDAEMLTDGNSVPGYALVSDTREMIFPNGRGELRFTDVAQRIDPTTVAFASLTDPGGTRVLEQNYQFDLVSQVKLLKSLYRRANCRQPKCRFGAHNAQGHLAGRA